MGCNSPAAREVPTVAVESLISPLNYTKRPATPAKSTLHKKKEMAEDCRARKAAEGTSKASKTKVVKVLAEAGKGPSGSQVTVLAGSVMINCVDGTVSSGTPMLVLVYDTTGRVVAMLQVPENLPPLPVSADIPRGKAGRCLGIWKNL